MFAVFGLTLAEFRDLVVIVYGAMGVILMMVLVIAAVIIALAVRALTRAVRALLDDPIRPTLEEVHRTAQNVRGSSEFITDSAVHPVIRAIAVGRGVKRGVGAVTGIRNRAKPSKK